MQTRVYVPARRVMGLAITETADEVLIYDTERHHIHHLNATTSAVWRACDGMHDVDEIARLASVTLGERLDEATVRLALTKLADADLLAGPLPTDLSTVRVSRRRLMRNAAIAGMVAVPAIISTTSPAFAATQCENSCTTNGICQGSPTPYTSNPCQYCVGGLCKQFQPSDGCGAPCTKSPGSDTCSGNTTCKTCSGPAGFCQQGTNCGRACTTSNPCPTGGTCTVCNQGVCSSTAQTLGVVANNSQAPLRQQVSVQSPTPSPTETPTPTQTPTPEPQTPTPTEVPPTDTPTPEPPTPTPTDVPPTDTPVPTPTPTDVPVQNLAPAGQTQQQDGGTSGQSQQDTGAAGTPDSSN